MSNPHLYRRFNLLRPGGISPSKPVGSFVVGVPTKEVRTFQTENPNAETIKGKATFEWRNGNKYWIEPKGYNKLL